MSHLEVCSERSVERRSPLDMRLEGTLFWLLPQPFIRMVDKGQENFSNTSMEYEDLCKCKSNRANSFD